MLTKVRSLTFSPNLVEALLSMTALALKSYIQSVSEQQDNERRRTASRKALVAASFCLKDSR